MAQARRSLDAKQREVLYRQADAILTREAYVVPLLYERSDLLVKPWVSRFPLSPLHRFQWENVVIEAHSS